MKKGDTTYALSTNAGGIEMYFAGVNGVKPNFIDDITESMFMLEDEAIRLKEVLVSKTNLSFEIIEITFD